MTNNEKPLLHQIAKLKEIAKEQKKQIEILKTSLKQLKLVYNEDLIKYTAISSQIIIHEQTFEKYYKQLTKIKCKLIQIYSIITEDFIESLKTHINLIDIDTKAIIAQCFGFPNTSCRTITLSFDSSSQLIDMLKYSNELQKALYIDDFALFETISKTIVSLKSSTNQFGYQINQLLSHFLFIQEKITIDNAKTNLMSEYDTLNKDKNEYYISLKGKEKEINLRYNAYKLKCDYMKKIGEVIKQYKEYELLGSNSSYNDMTVKMNLLLNTNIDSFSYLIKDNNDYSLGVCNQFEDSLTDGFSCSFMNDYSVNQDLNVLKQENRMIDNGTNIISLSPIIDKETKNYFCNSSLLKKKTAQFYKKKDEKTQVENENEGTNRESLDQFNQMIEDSKYEKQINTSQTMNEGTNANSIQNLTNKMNQVAEDKITRGRLNKNANYSLK